MNLLVHDQGGFFDDPGEIHINKDQMACAHHFFIITMNNIIAEKDYFKSSDLPMVAALVCCGYVVETIDKTEPRRAVFYLRRDERMDELIQRFFVRQLTVDPSTFFHVLKDLKTRLYEK